MSARIKNWPSVLEIFIWEHTSRPFAWGVQDCCTFAGDWVELALAAPLQGRSWRGTYKTFLGAMLQVGRVGGVAKIPGLWGLDSIPANLATRGDLVAVATPLGLALGVCLGPKIAVPGRKGLVFMDRIMGRNGWRVG